MTSTICFKNIEALTHLRGFIEEYLDRTVGPFVQSRSLRANVVVEKLHHHGHPDFCCEILLYHPALRKTLVAKKSSTNFYKSIRDTCRAIEKSLRRLAQTKSKRRHRHCEIVA